MNRIFTVVFAAAVLAFAVGCGKGKGLDLQKDDELVLLEELERISFEAYYGANKAEVRDTEGGRINIPSGSVLKILMTPKADTRILEVMPVKVNELTSEEEIRNFLIPERYWNKDGFLYYTVMLTVGDDDLGKKYKKKN